MDRGSYEKLSIRDSAASLKKYGSTSRHVSRNEHFIKHYVSNTDTLQGIALKYNVTIEQIRRSNKLWASDSLFLREFLLIPSSEPNVEEKPPTCLEPEVASPRTSSFDDDENINEFLNKIDAAIATTKEDVKKTTQNSEFSVNSELNTDRRAPAVSRMKQIVNNNSSGGDSFHPPHTVVVQQGKKVKTSLRHHEEQQDELFQL